MTAWDLSCRDWEARLSAGRSLVPTLPLDLVVGNRAVAVFNKLRLADVVGTPTMEEAGGDWFRDIVRALFGSLDPVTKARLIRELFVLVPKKNSKTTNGALMMLTALLLNERPRAPMALMAPVQKTAEDAFNAAAGAIDLDPVLGKKLHVRDHLKTIVHREMKAELQIMTFDPEMLTGKKFVAALVDELHVISKAAKAAKAIRQVRGGMVPFPEAFLAFITTMPDDPPVGVMEGELRKARDIRDGKRTGNMLPVLYELPAKVQQERNAWKDPALWPLVTPNLDRSVTMAALRELFDDAEAKGEDEMRGWASQHLNLEIGLHLRSDRWAGADFWEQQGRKEIDLDYILEHCEVVDVGIDGGGLDDLLGLYVVGRHAETKRKIGWGHAWAHPSVLERRKEIVEALRGFERDGDLTMVQAVGQDVDEVAEIVRSIEERGLLDKVGLDQAGIGAILDALIGPEEGAPGFLPRAKVIGISQGWKMIGAIKTAERWLAGGELEHDGSRLMAWCCGNARVVPLGNAVVIHKQASGTAKIDPLMALFDAVTLMSLNPEAAGKSFWETTGSPATA